MKNDLTLLRGYGEFLSELKQRIQSARLFAIRAVNRDIIRLYWDIGKAILERQKRDGWGESIINGLARDLRSAFPETRGFSERNLRDMKRFYKAYSDPLIWRQLVAKLDQASLMAAPQRDVARSEAALGNGADGFGQTILGEVPWGHHLLILNKTNDSSARLYYLRAASNFGWSRNALLNQIKAQSYERSRRDKTHNFRVAMPENRAEQAEEMLKSSYSLDFLGVNRPLKERELEDNLIYRLQRFIMELGYGFCFIGRQYRLTLGNKEYFVDLLFYHRFLKALVAIELKVGPFEPEFAGKMDFYLNLLNEKERAPNDHPSIGIILCAEKDNLEVEFSLKTKTNPIGVAEYQLVPKLPKEFKGHLPGKDELLAALRGASSLK